MKQGNLEKFESRSSDGIFLSYASHSHAYRVLNLETNQVVETCEVTFDETMPCSIPVFESAGDQEIGESIFVKENEEDAN
jgi:O-phosphoseryl-tRNA(Cys) synthetase